MFSVLRQKAQRRHLITSCLNQQMTGDWHWRQQWSAVVGMISSFFFPTDPEPVARLIVPLSANAGNLKPCWMLECWWESVLHSLLMLSCSVKLRVQTYMYLWPPSMPAAHLRSCRLPSVSSMRCNSRRLIYHTKRAQAVWMLAKLESLLSRGDYGWAWGVYLLRKLILSLLTDRGYPPLPTLTAKDTLGLFPPKTTDKLWFGL